MSTEAIFEAPTEVPAELLERARDRGWPDELVPRAIEVRIGRRILEEWLDNEHEDVKELMRFLGHRERLLSSTMQVREATWQDDDAVADLYASSQERLGDWEITVERSPFPSA